MDIVDKLRAKAPSKIDLFHQDMKRRAKLTDDKIHSILADIFNCLNQDHFTPEQEFRYNLIKSNVC